jgi:sporulation protein YlmC with PRC-barrel domain
MKTEVSARLVRLSEAGLQLTDIADIRGWDVVDRDGEELGKVSDLFIDEGERRTRFLDVKSGGFLGFGARDILVPSEAVALLDVDDKKVRLDQTREYAAGSPEYDPDTVDDRYWEGIYAYYGCKPYWTTASTRARGRSQI